jgi:hypothetical protein
MNIDMKKQTAVEWLINELKLNDTIEKENLIIARQIIEQAKAMEKEQILNAWYDCKLSIVDKKPMDAEEYYNETYGGDK